MNFRKTFFREYDSLKKTVITVTVITVMSG